jgi:hypothetical protein
MVSRNAEYRELRKVLTMTRLSTYRNAQDGKYNESNTIKQIAHENGSNKSITRPLLSKGNNTLTHTTEKNKTQNGPALRM